MNALLLRGEYFEIENRRRGFFLHHDRRHCLWRLDLCNEASRCRDGRSDDPEGLCGILEGEGVYGKDHPGVEQHGGDCSNPAYILFSFRHADRCIREGVNHGI